MKAIIRVLLSLSITLVACEDKNSSAKKPISEPQDTTQIQQNTKSNKDSLEKEKSSENVREDGPLLVQEELIPFLLKYDKEHPENKVRIKTRFGNIDVELFHDTPLHRANFLLLVNRGYFNGTFFHRVSEGFVIQGGNSDRRDTNVKRFEIGNFLIPSEFEAGHKHVRGALSAAKYAEQNVSKASSPYEFFIVQSPGGAHHLDNEHTVFGRVINGMDVVDEINKVATDESEWPLTNIHITTEILE